MAVAGCYQPRHPHSIALPRKITRIETRVCNARMRNWVFVKVARASPTSPGSGAGGGHARMAHPRGRGGGAGSRRARRGRSPDAGRAPLADDGPPALLARPRHRAGHRGRRRELVRRPRPAGRCQRLHGVQEHGRAPHDAAGGGQATVPLVASSTRVVCARAAAALLSIKATARGMRTRWSLDIHASVEHTEHRDVRLVHDQICDPIVAIRPFANISIVARLISLPKPRMLRKQ